MDKSVLEQLREKYDTFTGAEKKIADYVLANQWDCQSLGIADLGGECGVAVSTVSVFCRKLGLNGFNDFKMELARANTLSADRRPTALSSTEPQRGDTAAQIMHKACVRSQEILSRSRHMLSPGQVERALPLLRDAGQVLILGQGPQNAVATLTWAQFSVDSSRFRIVSDSHLQNIALSNLTREDVVLYFCFSGATMEVMEAAEAVRRAGAKLILVTRFSRSPAAEFADVVLVAGADENGSDFGSADALLSQLYVMEVLLGCYRLYCAEH